jgi:hypothetical protein
MMRGSDSCVMTGEGRSPTIFPLAVPYVVGGRPSPAMTRVG